MTSNSGLYGHIRRNTLKSLALLAGFVGLAFAFWFTLLILHDALFWWPKGQDGLIDLEFRFYAIMSKGLMRTIATWWVPVLAAAIWVAVALTWHAALIRLVTRARPVSRREQTKLYDMVENLAVTAGLPMPRIEVMPSNALNAYATGIGPDDAAIAVTRGLLAELEDDELEAVLAHEMAHIANRDVRLMVVASVLAGALSILGASVSAFLFGSGERDPWENDDGTFGLPTMVMVGALFAVTVILVAFWMVAAVALFAGLTKFAISRSREFLADAGAVELTRNPDALIAALTKIDGRDKVPVWSSSVQAMMFSFDAVDLFATHPPIEARIEALKRHAGGRVRAPKSGGIRRFGDWARRRRAGLRHGTGSPIRG